MSLRTVPTNTWELFFAQFISIREKQILQGVLESKKKIGGNHAFFRDSKMC